MPRKNWRKLHFIDEIWTYRISSNGVVIRDSTRKSHYIDLPTFCSALGVKFWTWDNLERGRRKGYYPEIGPSDVKSYIRKVLLSADDLDREKKSLAMTKVKV